MAGLSTGTPIVQVYHEKSRILPDVSRVLACLYEKDIKFERHTASYKSLLKLQASTHAPVPFYDGLTFLEESREICRYIAEKYEHHGYPFLLGKDALERASVEQWLHNEEHAFNPPSRALFCHLAFPPDKDDNGDNGGNIDMHTRKLEEVLDVYEQRLSDSQFLAGNMFTLADLVHLPNCHYIKASNKFLYLYDSRKNVRRWWDAISRRDSWQQVLMDMKRVEEQNKQEELKKQQQKNLPRTPGYPLQIHSREQTTTEPQTIFMHPAGTVSSSSVSPQTEKPIPTDIPDEPQVSLSQSTPTAHKISVAKSKEKTPQKSPMPVRCTIAPVTSPTTSEKPPTVGVAWFSTKDASSPEVTKTNPHTRSEPISSKDASNNLHMLDYSKAISQSEEATTSIEPTPQKGPETLDLFSGSSISPSHTKTSSIPTTEEPGLHSKSDSHKSDNTSTGVDSQEMYPVPYYEDTSQSARPTESAASNLHTTDDHHKLQVGQWHAATTVPSNIKEDAGHLSPIQQVESSKYVQQHSQDSEQATSLPVLQESVSMELVEGQEKVTQRPYTDQRRDVSYPLPQQSGGVQGIPVDGKSSFDQRGALLPPSAQKHTATIRSRETAAKEAHSTRPPQVAYQGGQDTNRQLRDPGSIAGQTTDQATFGEPKAPVSITSSGGSSHAFRSPLPRQDLDAAHHTATPWQMADQDTEDTENTTGETKAPYSSSSQVQPPYFQRAKVPSEKQETTEGLVREKETKDNHDATSPIHKRAAEIEDTDGEYRDIAFKPKQMISQDDRDTFKETNSGDPLLIKEQPPDTQQAAATTDEETNHGDLSVAPRSERTKIIYCNVTGSNTRSPIVKDASKQPIGVPSTPWHKAAQHDGTSEETMTSDEVASTEQPLNAQRAPVSPRRREVEDSPRGITTFPKRYPYVEDMQIASSGAKDTFEELKIAESSPTNANPLYNQQFALRPQRQAEVQHAQEKGVQSEARSPELQKIVSRDARDTHGERKTGTPREQSSESLQAIPRPRPGADEDAHDATGGTIQFPNIFDTTQKSRGTNEEAQDAGSTLPRARPLGAQGTPESQTSPVEHQRKNVSTQLQFDAQDSFPQSKLSAADQTGSSEQLKEMTKNSQSKAQPVDSQGSTKVDKTSFVYKKKPQIIPSGDKGDDSILEHEEASDATYNDEKLSVTAPSKEKSRNDINAEKSYKKGTADDKQMVSPQQSKEPTTQVQPSPGSSQDEAPRGDLSSKPSNIEQWHRVSAPLRDITTSSDEQRVETSILPIEPETAGVQSTSPSFPEAVTTGDAVNDAKSEKHSIIAEKQGEPKQIQAPVTDTRPASSAKRTPNDPETSDLELVRSAAKVTPPGPATSREDSHGAAMDEKTKTYDVSGDQLVTGPLHEQSRPPTPTHEATDPIGGRETSMEPQLPGSSLDEVVPAERKSTVSDKKPDRASPLSPVEPVNIDSTDYATADTITRQMIFQQQTRPSAPTIRGVPASDSQNITRKIQEVIPDHHRTENLGKLPVPNQEDQSRYASQAIHHPEDMKYSPSTRDPQKSDIQPASAQVHDVTPDESSEKQSPIGDAFTPNELNPTEKKFIPSDQGLGHSADQPSSAEPRKEYPVASTAKQIKAWPTVIRKQGTPEMADVDTLSISTHGDAHPTTSTKPPRSVEPTPSTQESSYHVAHDSLHTGATPDDAVQHAQSMHPLASPDAQHGQDSVHPKHSPLSMVQRNKVIGDSNPETQQDFSMRPRKEVDTPDQAKGMPISLDQQEILSAPPRSISQSSDTQRPSEKAIEDTSADDLGEAASESPSDIREVKPPTVVPASAPVAQHGAATDEIALDKQKIVSSGQDSLRSTQPPSSPEQRNGESEDSALSTQWISSTKPKKGDVDSAPDQAKDSEITHREQNILPSITSVSPSSDIQRPSGKVHEDVHANNLGEAKPVVQSTAPDTQDEALQDEATPDEKNFAPPGQDSVHSTLLRNGEIGDSALSTQRITSTRPIKGDANASTPFQAKDTQLTPSRQDILPPVGLESLSSDSQPPSEPTSSTEPGHKEIRESAPSKRQISSTAARKENAIVAACNQGKDLQTTLEQQDIPSTPVRSASPSSDTQHPSERAREYAPADDLGEAASKSLTLVREVKSPPGPTEASFPEHGVPTQPPLTTQDISLDALSKAKSAGQETQLDSTQAQDEAAPVVQNFAVSDQESARASKSPSTAGPRKGEAHVFGPVDQIKLPNMILENQDTRQTPDTREALSKFQESSHDDDGISNLANPLVSQQEASHAERSSEEPTSEEPIVDEKATPPFSQAQTSNTGPDSTPVTGDAHLTNADMSATSKSQEAPHLKVTETPMTQARPASSQDVHADSLGNMDTPRQPSKDEVLAPAKSSATYSDAPKSEPRTATVQPPQEASFDMSGGEKTATTQGGQVNTVLNSDLSTSQPVRPSESADFKGTNSEQKLEETSTYENSKAQDQTDHFQIQSSKDKNNEVNKETRSDLWPEENRELSGELEHQEQADQGFVQSLDGKMKQIEQTKTHDTETGGLEERDPQENTNQTNSKVSQVEALDSSSKQTSGVQLQGENRKDASNSAYDGPDDIQTVSNPDVNLASFEEYKVQQQSEGKTKGGETGAPLSDTAQPNGRGLPEDSYQNDSSQSQAVVSEKSAEKFSPGIENKNKSSSGLDGPTDGTKSGNAEDNSG